MRMKQCPFLQKAHFYIKHHYHKCLICAVMNIFHHKLASLIRELFPSCKHCRRIKSSLACKATVYTINELIAPLHAEKIPGKQGLCSHNRPLVGEFFPNPLTHH